MRMFGYEFFQVMILAASHVYEKNRVSLVVVVVEGFPQTLGYRVEI